MHKKIILFDIDYTLFDTDLFRDKTYPKLMHVLEQDDTPKYHERVAKLEKELIISAGYEPIGFGKTLAEVLSIKTDSQKLEKLFYDPILYKECLYPEVKEVLEKLLQRKNSVLGVVSKGDRTFQERKISAISKYFSLENRFISLEKTDLITKILKQFANDKIFIIDDSAPFLDSIKKADAAICAILVEKPNRYEKRLTPIGFQPDAVITNLTEIIPIVDKLSID